MTDQEIVDEINKMFPPQSIGYNVAFIVDGKPMVTGVHKELSRWLSKNGLWCEWEHGGGIHIYRQEKTDIS